MAAKPHWFGGLAGDRSRAVCVFLFLLVVYNSNLRYIASFDSLASSLLPFRVLEGKGLTLADPSAAPAFVTYSIVRSRDGSFVSLYPVVVPLVVAPLYVPAVLFKRAFPEKNENYLRMYMEKLSASIVMAAAAALFYVVLRRVSSGGLAGFLTVAYALGTSCWTTGSQALWQQGTAQLLMAAILLCLAQAATGGWSAGLLGVLAGMLTGNRPTDIFFSLAVAGVVAVRWRRHAWPFTVTAGVVAALLLSYNLHHFESPAGGYTTLDQSWGEMLGNNAGGLVGILGLLFSNRGLLTYSPILLLLAAYPWRRDVIPGTRALLVAYLASLWLHGSFSYWPAGYCYGPRYAMQGLPILFVAIVPAAERLWRRAGGRALLALAAGFGIALQIIGAFYYPRGDSGSERFGIWTLRHSPPILAVTAGPAIPDLLYLLAPGHQRLRLRGPEDARAEYAWELAPPARLAPLEARAVRVRVANRSQVPWSSVGGLLGKGAVRMRVWWEGPSSRVLGENEEWLAWTLPAGGAVSQAFQVRAPAVRGPATLKVEVVEVHVRAFSQTGVPPLAGEVTIE